MLINITNHPLKSWSKTQIETAGKQFGIITDISFPKIAPDISEMEIDKLANTYFLNIIEKFNSLPDENNAVHIMGELTFTFNLVYKLLQNGIVCIASTTERNTKEFNDKKISEFNFVRFREYKL